MKVNVEIELSPQEARELMGWPDLSKYQEQVFDAFGKQLQEGNNEAVLAALSPFMSETQKAFNGYQKMMEGFLNIASQKK
ncbi:hypothetical protein KIH87_11380 [Paraneptunicella aestuarii]|uniref:DUF6489 family protein n=1 Tax=Paraneptunicella aestuarii TaxID=2831148 RepID=UPI001E4296C0|nr:DUF6489 family protein [Paraneptunicella aestuarii]UAA37325.1 hypothetical protein KIH87_11380 [Paraneptunicella aestuarii]